MWKYAGLGLILLITGLVYASSLPGTFYFDDFGLMLDNPRATTQFSFWSFLQQYGGRPLTLLTFHWNYQLGGRQPAGYHLVNVSLHLAAAALLFLLLERLSRNLRWSTLATLIFALHPLQTQAVNYVWARSVLLMTVFGLLSLLWVRRPWLALLAWQLAVWSRAEALVLALPMIYLASRDRSGPWRLPKWWKAVGCLMVFNLVSISWGVLLESPSEVAWNHSAIWSYWGQQPAAIFEYLTLMVWPAHLSIDRPWYNWDGAAIAGLALLLAGGIAFLWRRRHQQPVLAYGVLACLLALAPSLLVPNTVFVSESRSYLAVGGFAAAAAGILDWLWTQRPRLALLLASGLLLTASWHTLQRNRLWGDEIGIWREAVEQFPDFYRVHYNLGFALARHGFTEEAQAEFEASRRLHPQDDYSYAALGYCAEVAGKDMEARRLYLQALQLNPGNRYASEGLGRLEARGAMAGSGSPEP